MTPPPEVEAAWATCEEAWHEADRHDAFFALVAKHDCFAYAAGKYKARAGDAVADKHLERVRKAATAKMMATSVGRPDAARKPYRAAIAFIVLLLVMAIAGLAYVANMRGRQPQPPPTPASP
jgi:hypothetical protein